MGRKSSTQARAVLMPPGPLAAWRLSLAVGASFALTGMPLVRAARDHTDLDLALVRSLALAALVWVVLGGINRVLAAAEADRLAVAARLEAQVQAIMSAAAERDLLDDGSANPEHAGSSTASTASDAAMPTTRAGA